MGMAGGTTTGTKSLQWLQVMGEEEYGSLYDMDNLKHERRTGRWAMIRPLLDVLVETVASLTSI
ncbi:hypothetical protein FQN51_004657 [Onygenales sp. PD_10]|nr:hypothetical protein FQN51_004657 [Onygenales sp. PD_10]